ncbi:glutathione synthase [Candidatus Riesia pediculischaeffi]|nr:glutathione synthase [Candidatus Riesia pediculischaeffi]
MNDSIRLGIVMDSIENINIKKDSSFAMLLEAHKRRYQIYYMEVKDIYLINNEPFGSAKIIENIEDRENRWFEINKKKDISLKKLNVILMRKDPPYNMEYIYATHILERAERDGTMVINRPKSLRNHDEKICANLFTHLTPNTIVSRDHKKLLNFYEENQDVVIKPLGRMGGESVFRLDKNNFNARTVIETVTKKENVFCIMQKYVADVTKNGDKRILIINGKVVPYCLARIPKENNIRANLSSGGIGKVRSLQRDDWRIAKEIACFLKKEGIFFAGIDVIGNKLIEINITSPTCIREIESHINKYSITQLLFDEIELELSMRNTVD